MTADVNDPLQFGTTSPLQAPLSTADELGGYGDVPLDSHEPFGDPATAAADPLTTPAPPAAAAVPLPHAPAAAPAPAAPPPPPQPQQQADNLSTQLSANGGGADTSTAAPAGTAGEAPSYPSKSAYPAVPVPAVTPQLSPLVPEVLGSGDLRISVHSPATLRGPTAVPGLDESFVSFEVTTATSLPSFRCPQVTVRRRFKDVVALSRALEALLPGAILPARPGRNFVEGRLRMTPAFTEERRAAMERYLNRLATHPSVARSEVLRVWLEAEGTLRSAPVWLALLPKAPTPAQATARFVRTVAGLQRGAPTPAEAARPPGASRDLYRLIHERVAAMSGAGAAADAGPEEARLRDQAGMLEELGEALGAAVTKADAWAGAAGGAAAVWGDLGAALEGLSKFEATYGSVGAQPTVALATAARACAASRPLVAAVASALSSALRPLREHAASAPAALRALRRREAQLLTSATLRRDLEAARARLAAAQLAPGTQGRKLEDCRQQVAALEASQAAAAAEYERLLARNAAELDGLKAARGAELTAAVAHLAGVAYSHEQQAAAGWQATCAALPTMQGGPVTAYMAQRFFKPQA